MGEEPRFPRPARLALDGAVAAALAAIAVSARLDRDGRMEVLALFPLSVAFGAIVAPGVALIGAQSLRPGRAVITIPYMLLRFMTMLFLFCAMIPLNGALAVVDLIRARMLHADRAGPPPGTLEDSFNGRMARFGWYCSIHGPESFRGIEFPRAVAQANLWIFLPAFLAFVALFGRGIIDDGIPPRTVLLFTTWWVADFLVAVVHLAPILLWRAKHRAAA